MPLLCPEILRCFRAVTFRFRVMPLILLQTAVVCKLLGRFSPNNDYGQAKDFAALLGKKTILSVSLC